MELTDPKYRWYLVDLGPLLLERARDAKQRRDEAQNGSAERQFETGRLLAFNEVISQMQQQAASFAIPLDELGLAGVEPDREFV